MGETKVVGTVLSPRCSCCDAVAVRIYTVGQINRYTMACGAVFERRFGQRSYKVLTPCGDDDGQPET